MKSLSSRSFIAGSAICVAFGVATAQAEPLEYQCRAAVRAELKGPDCRMALPPNPTSHCNIPANADVANMDNKVNECVRRGGPGRQSKARS